MTAKVLKRAADEIRREQEREENLGHIGGREYATWMKVADWLDFCANQQLASPNGFAMKVATTYLGESS